MDEVVKILLRDMTVPYFIVMYLCALLGMAVFFYGDVKKGVDTDFNTSKKFSWGKMFQISGKRIIVSVIILFFVVIRYPELAKMIFNVQEPVQITVVSALFAGLGVDRIVDFVLKRGTEGVALVKKNGK